MAAGRVAPLAPWSLLLLLLLLLAGLTLQTSLSASQSNHDHDEEELQIARADGGLWHARGVARDGDAISGERPQTARSRTRKRENELLDPFAFTFEDYLREASGLGAAGQATSGNEKRADESDSESANLIATSDNEAAPRGRLIVESDDADQLTAVSSSRPADTRQPPHIETNSDNEIIIRPSASSEQQLADEPAVASSSRSPTTSNSQELEQEREQAEVRLHFAWVSLPTQRCSRPCGRGQRLLQLSCHDLKFNVRVSDELCHAARLAKPSEHSDEPCQEHDCPPQWTTSESQQCQDGSQLSSPSSSCKPKLFKRIECTMLTREGHTVHLDESRCADSERPAAPEVATGPDSSPASLDEDLSIDLNEQLDKERNEILLNEMPSEQELPMRQQASRHRKHFARPNEPFFEPGEWSDCVGTPCGQLGKRTRKLACRLYLARSAKFVDLPESSCLAASPGAVQPEREEPCYLDCGPRGALTNNSTHYHLDQQGDSDDDQELTIETLAPSRHEYQLTLEAASGEQEDEELLDPAAARYVWRHAQDWTKCSAECLGGLSESLVECWDRVANASVEQRHCATLQPLKPEPLRRSCNEGPCAPEWRLGPFTQCSRACGSAGSRSRSLACVQQVARATAPQHHSANYMLVSNDLCLEQQQLVNGSKSTPGLAEACNRHHCRPEWSVGPWSECSMAKPSDCASPEAGGERNRTVVCVQEFASQWGTLESERVEAGATNAKLISPELREAIQLAAPSWHPGKSTQVPFDECYREYHSAPAPSERCTPAACLEPELFIDAEPAQDYRTLLPDGMPNPNYSTRRRTVTLKIGGRAQLLEGRHVKIRCRILAKSRAAASHLVNGTTTTAPTTSSYQAHQQQLVEWRKDGVRIFAPNTTMADKQPFDETDNSISVLGASSDELPDNELSINFEPDKYSMMAADEPETRRQQRLEAKARAKTRQLRVRSGQQDFQFVARPGGRFTLVKENTLRIKRLRLDDAGIYTCASGAHLSESIELSVLRKRGRHAVDLRGHLRRVRPPTSNSNGNLAERAPSSSASTN